MSNVSANASTPVAAPSDAPSSVLALADTRHVKLGSLLVPQTAIDAALVSQVKSAAKRHAARNVITALLPDFAADSIGKMAEAKAQLACFTHGDALVKTVLDTDAAPKERRAARTAIARGGSMLSAKAAVKLFLASWSESES